MENTKVWLVTGASQGLGLATVKYLLTRGHTVIATTRGSSKFDHSIAGHQNLEVLSLDLTSEVAVSSAVSQIAAKYGRIDVLINNAGYGFLGAVEEATSAEIDQIMSVNVSAVLRMVRHVLPYMRSARKGHIINLSSIAGIVSAPGFGIYNASKYAVEGFTEAMSHELKDLGIQVTLIEPGAFRTNFLDSSLTLSQITIADYDSTAGSTKTKYLAFNGQQPGDPERAAQEIVAVAEMADPPLRLLLGEDAYTRALAKLDSTRAEMERMKSITLSTSFGELKNS